MDVLYQALLFGAITALSALVTHHGVSAFHDGVRPFIGEVAAGRMERRGAARSAWQMSVGFVAYYGAPFSLATGVMEKHVLGLPADWIGVRYARASVAAAMGFAWGAAAGGALAGIRALFSDLPRPIDHSLLTIGRPLFAMLPLIPVVAAFSQFRRRGGAIVGTVTAAAYIAANVTSVGHPQAIAFGAGAIAMLAMALRERVPDPPPVVPELAEGAGSLRRAVPALSANGALLALGASLLWLAGEPASVMLVGLHHRLEAGLVGLYSWVGFVALVTFTSMAGRAYTTAGMPDGVLGLGLLARLPPVAAAVGALAMGTEIVGVTRFERMLARHPGLHAAGGAIRDGLLLVSELGLLIGGALSANSMWPGVGFFVVGGFWLANEALGVPVMRVAVGPLAAILTGLALNIRVAF